MIGSLPFLLGLAIVMPVLGHATWHLYRKVVEPIEDTNNLGQQILHNDEHYDINVSGKKGHRMTKRIVLVTVPIPDPDGQNTPRDDQDNP